MTAIVSAQANINSAKANIAAAASDVRRLEILKSFELVTAPFAGIITARNIENGSLIANGGSTTAPALFHIAATDPVRVFIDVPQAYAPTIETGQKVQLIVREFAQHPYVGTVVRTSGSIDTASRTLHTEVHVPNSDHKLLTGMYAQVKVSIVRAHPPLLVPNSALIVNADGNQLAVVRDGHVHFEKVELDGDYGNEFGITGGVTESDMIIANPSERLTENCAVTVANVQK
jgi:RND family efflux transporter MFP subunit